MLTIEEGTGSRKDDDQSESAKALYPLPPSLSEGRLRKSMPGLACRSQTSRALTLTLTALGGGGGGVRGPLGGGVFRRRLETEND